MMMRMESEEKRNVEIMSKLFSLKKLSNLVYFFIYVSQLLNDYRKKQFESFGKITNLTPMNSLVMTLMLFTQMMVDLNFNFCSIFSLNSSLESQKGIGQKISKIRKILTELGRLIC